MLFLRAFYNLRWFFLFTAFTSVYSQVEMLNFHAVGLDQGAPTDPIHAISQDGAGFIWMGTSRGLYRYDGYETLFFENNPDDTNSLPDNHINALSQDSLGRIWIATDGGLALKEPDQNRFERLDTPKGVTALVEDGDAVLGVSGSTIWRLGSDQTEPLAKLDRIGPITALYGNSGSFWVGSEKGLFRINRALPKGAPIQVFDRSVSFITGSREAETFWIGSGNELFEYESGKLKLIKGPWTLPEFNMALFEDGRLWLGSNRGLIAYTPEKNLWSWSGYQVDLPGTLVNNVITSLFVDRTGLVWIGTEGGTCIYNPDNERFTLYDSGNETSIGPYAGVNSIYKGADSYIWTGNQGYLNRVDRKSQEVTRYDLNDQAVAAGYIVWGISGDSAGKLWLATEGDGLHRFDPQKKTFQSWRHNPEDLNTISTNNLWSVTVDSRDVLWIGTNGAGLNRFDPETGQVTRFKTNNTDPTTIGDNQVFTIIEDSKSMIWICTWGGGLNRYDQETDKFTRYTKVQANPNSLSHNWVNMVHEEQGSNGERFWVATNEGLNLLDAPSGKIRNWRRRDGLPGNVICAIASGPERQIWIVTDGGIAHMNIDDESFFTYRDWSLLNDKGYHQGVSFQADDGEFFVGRIDSMVSFHPGSLPKDTSSPQATITNIQLFNQDLAEVIDNPRMAIPAHAIERLDLNHDQYPVSIAFSGNHFAYPEGNRFAYRMVGVDRDWIETDASNRKVSYSKLSPGRYTFHVKAANKDGFWQEGESNITLVIHPPPWRTWWAWCGYALVIIGVSCAYVIAQSRKKRRLRDMILKRTKQLERRNAQILQSQKQLITQEKMASLGTITAGIAHEIRNPLNFINNFSEISKELTDELWECIQPHQDRLPTQTLEEIREIIQDLKLNNSKIGLHGERAEHIVHTMGDLIMVGNTSFETISPAPLAREIVELTLKGFKAKHIGITVDTDFQLSDQTGEIIADHRALSKVFIHLINNALDALLEKSSEAGPDWKPRLQIESTGNETHVNIHVRDNGVGIPPGNMGHIFTPFFTTKAGLGVNPGLGLAVSYDIIANEHGGTIKATSSNEETTFTITLPRKQQKAE